MVFNLEIARQMMEEQEFNCLMPTTRPNILYSSRSPTGTVGSKERIAAVILPIDSDPTFSLQYNEQFYSKKISWIKDIRIYEGEEWLPFKPWKYITEIIKEKKLDEGKIGVETDAIPYDNMNYLKKLLPKAEFANCKTIFERLRAVRSQKEIKIMDEAGTKTSKAIKVAFEWPDQEKPN
jgi:Xaa-Pro aminopeptidase